MKNPIHFLIVLGFPLSLILANCRNSSGQEGNSASLNRLAEAGSPYLREHADNPVDWHEWGPEALQKAKDENKPLIISIGYSSCHWCHVMEEESFMDTAVARIMNEHFIAIKVDREERPDIDQIYLNAAQLLTGNAGWPLNAFALPDGKPFYAVTYFPKEEWVKLLHHMHEAFTTDRGSVNKQARALTRGVDSYERITFPGTSKPKVSQDIYVDIFQSWPASLDNLYGGLNGAPKFPMPSSWEFLLQYYFLTGNKNALEITKTTLDHMACGGIYDQLGGGFSRYSTDREWKVPHFEKMLYDNAQLVSLYAHAWQVTKDPLYAEIFTATLDFMARELTSPEGGFYSSINADSEGEEGIFYTWTKAEIETILDAPTAELVSAYYHVSDSGNWEDGKNILYTDVKTTASFAADHQMTPGEWANTLDAARRKLLQARTERIRPSTDDKILTSWNALMLTGYIDAYVATTSEEYLATGLRNARFLLDHMVRDDGSLWRSYKDGNAGIEAFLDDYAFLARAFIALYEVTFDMQWLDAARSLTEYAIDHFRDGETGMFYYTADVAEGLIARKTEIADQAMPSSNSVMSEVLLLLGEYYQDPSYTAKANMMVNQVLRERLTASGIFHANWASVAGISAWQPFEVAVIGPAALERSIEMQRHFNPLAIYLGGSTENLPLLKNKLVEGKTIIYVCRDRVCKLPVREVSAALDQLKNF